MVAGLLVAGLLVAALLGFELLIAVAGGQLAGAGCWVLSTRYCWLLVFCFLVDGCMRDGMQMDCFQNRVLCISSDVKY
jgi:hypothetical protein